MLGLTRALFSLDLRYCCICTVQLIVEVAAPDFLIEQLKEEVRIFGFKAKRRGVHESVRIEFLAFDLLSDPRDGETRKIWSRHYRPQATAHEQTLVASCLECFHRIDTQREALREAVHAIIKIRLDFSGFLDVTLERDGGEDGEA